MASWHLFTAMGALAASGLCCASEARATRPDKPALDPIHNSYPAPRGSEWDDPPEAANDSLSAAIAEAFATNPDLAARRYDLRAGDDEVGLALSQTRPTLSTQVSGRYDLILPGSATNASRPISDRLNDPNIERNELTSQLVLDQPLYTGGRAASALRAALANGVAGRATLRGIEGDLLLELIAAYSDVRRDTRTFAIRRRNLSDLEGISGEVAARRDAGELTRTDIAQAENQLLAARVQLDAAEAQLESSRAAFTAIVGRAPGVLAPMPDLPNLPRTAEEAFAEAELENPELAAAVATRRASQARIGAAEAEGRPELSLRGTAGTNGPASPFDRFEHDANFTGQLTLTVPVIQGGRVASLIAQARNRESADALRIDATRRNVVEAIVRAWNQWVTSSRNAEAQTIQIQAARIYFEGTLEEYREGLRSTFDVLFAQNALRDTEVALLASERDRYVAQAALLRQLGHMEARKLLTDGPRYDPDAYLERVKNRSAVPWDWLVRAADRLGSPRGKPQAIEPVGPGSGSEPQTPAGAPDAPDALLRSGPAIGEPSGPIPDGSRQR